MRGLQCGSRMHLHAFGSTAQRSGRVGASEVAWKPPRGRPDNTHFLSTMADPHDSETVPDTLTELRDGWGSRPNKYSSFRAVLSTECVMRDCSVLYHLLKVPYYSRLSASVVFVYCIPPKRASLRSSSRASLSNRTPPTPRHSRLVAPTDRTRAGCAAGTAATGCSRPAPRS